MFLHIGGDVVVSLKSIISILDFASVIKSKDTRLFLQTAEEEGFIRRINDQEPKSLIITEKVQGKRKEVRKPFRRSSIILDFFRYASKELIFKGIPNPKFSKIRFPI